MLHLSVCHYFELILAYTFIISGEKKISGTFYFYFQKVFNFNIIIIM